MVKGSLRAIVALGMVAGVTSNVSIADAARAPSVTVLVSCSQDTEFYAKVGSVVEFEFDTNSGCTGGSVQVWNVSERDGSKQGTATGFLAPPKSNLVTAEYAFLGRDYTPNDWYLYQDDLPTFTSKLLRSRKALGVTYSLVPDTNIAGVLLAEGSTVEYWIIWKGPTAP